MVFDKAGLLTRLMDDDELVDVVVDAMREDGPAQIAALRAAVESGDLPVATRLAHGIKGAAGNASAQALSRTAALLEEAGKTRDHDRLAELLPDLQHEWNRLEAEFVRSGFPAK